MTPLLPLHPPLPARCADRQRSQGGRGEPSFTTAWGRRCCTRPGPCSPTKSCFSSPQQSSRDVSSPASAGLLPPALRTCPSPPTTQLCWAPEAPPALPCSGLLTFLLPAPQPESTPISPTSASPPPSPRAPCPLLHCLGQLKVLCSVLPSSRPRSLTTWRPQHRSRHFGAVARPASSSQSAPGKQHWDRARPCPVPPPPPFSQ